MTEQSRPAAPPHPSGRSAALAHLTPYVAGVTAVALLGAPAELAVPLVRRLRRESGVAVGPGLTNLANGLIALAVTHSVRSRPALHWGGPRTRVWAGIAVCVYLTVSPVAAGRWRRGVVLRNRSPLWGASLSPIGLLQIALVLEAVARARRSAEEAGSAGGDVPGPGTGA